MLLKHPKIKCHQNILTSSYAKKCDILTTMLLRTWSSGIWCVRWAVPFVLQWHVTRQTAVPFVLQSHVTCQTAVPFILQWHVTCQMT